jgi:hypothetical protein
VVNRGLLPSPDKLILKKLGVNVILRISGMGKIENLSLSALLKSLTAPV